MAVGEVVGVHGLRGQLRVRPFQHPAPSLAAGCTVSLERDGTQETARVLAATPHGRGLLLVTIAGIADRTAAEACRGARIVVPAIDLPPLAAGEFYWHEITGFEVATTGGQVLGTVASTMATGLNDVWVVRSDEREYLIPVIADIVRNIDRAARRILIEPLPGLLE